MRNYSLFQIAVLPVMDGYFGYQDHPENKMFTPQAMAAWPVFINAVYVETLIYLEMKNKHMIG